jgi:hypothetical protein
MASASASAVAGYDILCERASIAEASWISDISTRTDMEPLGTREAAVRRVTQPASSD